MPETIKIMDLAVSPGGKLRTFLTVPGTEVQIPITIINGVSDGPTLLVTSGIHGGEYPGIAAAMELGKEIEPEELSGRLIIMHPVNVQGFWARQAFIVPEDGKNLNREFPGNPEGTLAERTAYLLSHHFFPLADFYVDMHSGDIHEELHPYVYYPGIPTEEIAEKSKEVAQVLDLEFMVRSTATTGAYNCAALNGIPSILIERGGAGLCRREEIDAYKQDIHNILRKLRMFCHPVRPRRHRPRDVENIIYLQTDITGCWMHHIHSGDYVEKGQELGRMVNVFGETITTYYAEQDGVILYLCPSLAAPKDTVLVAYGQLSL